MARWLVAASIAWPLLLGASVAQRSTGQPAAWTTVVYLAASRICHQRHERSFHTGGVQWPVCGRCAGLYLAAPFGAIAGLSLIRRRAREARAVAWLAAASVPTVATLALEWSGAAPVTNLARAVAAAPLGAAIAFVIVRVAAEQPKPIG